MMTPEPAPFVDEDCEMWLKGGAWVKMILSKNAFIGLCNTVLALPKLSICNIFNICCNE